MGADVAYDAFGNVTKTGNGGTSYMATYNAQTNQVQSGVTATYDANGNQTMTNFVSPMTYDANQNPVVAGSTNLLYDALGRLVEAGGKAVVYGPDGEKIGVFNGSSYTASFGLPGGGEAYYTSGTLTTLRRKDWLGSSRLATSWAHVPISKAAYAPFGETYDTAGPADYDFTGQTQDSVSTLFDFPARKYDPNAGRWTVPDPGAWDVVDPTNPQSFNRYAYVLNNPLMFVDPSGMFGCDASSINENCDQAYGTYEQQMQEAAMSANPDPMFTGSGEHGDVPGLDIMFQSGNTGVDWDSTDPENPVNINAGLNLMAQEGAALEGGSQYFAGFGNGIAPSGPGAQNNPNSPCPAGTTPVKQSMLTTGYDNTAGSTGKSPGMAGFGVTATNTLAGPGTIATVKKRRRGHIPFGTPIFVPGYGLGTVQDSGGGLHGNHIDLWFPSPAAASAWGNPHLNVTICKKD